MLTTAEKDLSQWMDEGIVILKQCMDATLQELGEAGKELVEATFSRFERLVTQVILCYGTMLTAHQLHSFNCDIAGSRRCGAVCRTA